MNIVVSTKEANDHLHNSSCSSVLWTSTSLYGCLEDTVLAEALSYIPVGDIVTFEEQPADPNWGPVHLQQRTLSGKSWEAKVEKHGEKSGQRKQRRIKGN